MDLDPDLDLVLTREVKAPRDLLYECWTTPEHLVHWFVPKPHKVTACQLDVRVGGDRIEVGGLHDRIAEEAQGVSAMLIGVDVEDVGGTILERRCRVVVAATGSQDRARSGQTQGF